MSEHASTTDTRCGLYRVGHQPHHIQARLASTTTGTDVRLTCYRAVARDRVPTPAGGPVGPGPLELWVVVGDTPEVWWIHDDERTRSRLDLWARRGATLYGYGLLSINPETDDDPARPAMHPCRDPEEWVPCRAGRP